MLRRVCLILAFTFSVLTISAHILAAEIDLSTYDIYSGDINGDGAKDFFFKSKPSILILHGDIATPIFFYKNIDFVVYRNGNDYFSPVAFTLSLSEVATRIANGTLKIAQKDVDYFSWSNGLAGQTNLLLRGVDFSAPALFLTTSANSALPNSSRALLTQNYPGISDRNVRLTLADINYDGRKDIILEDISTSAAWKTAYIASADVSSDGVPTYIRELRPSTTAPSGGGTMLVGSTAAKFRVDESGAATYEVGITLADGVAGVKPQLSLGYSSNMGNGIAGQGWSLSGISAITRCRQTLVQDNKAMPITWSADDRFCLNGQRLMIVSGSYGAPESTYSTEIDNFAVVTAKGGVAGHPAYFTVEAKDGSTSYFGNTVDSKLVGSASNPNTTILTWSINRFRDNVGNSIDFVYEGNAIEGLRINTIHYAFPTTNDGLNAARVDSSAQIKFSYDSRTDRPSSYVSGYLFAQTKRLSKVSVNNDGKELRSYNLAYMPDADSGNRYKNNISRLEAIQECNVSTCLVPLMFKWGGGSFISLVQGSTQVNLINASSGKYLLNNLFADANGDGKQDLIYLMYDSNQANSSQPNRATVSVHVQYAGKPDFVMYSSTVDDYVQMRVANLDYNADGRQDIAIYDGHSWRIYLATVTADAGNGNWANFAYIADSALVDRDTFFTDYNGDGLVDAVSSTGYLPLVPNPTQDITSSHFYKFGTLVPFSFDANDFPELKQTVSDLDVNCQVRVYSKTILPSSIGDFNGDGVADFAGSITETVANKCSFNYTPHVKTGKYSFVVRDGKLTKYSTLPDTFTNVYAVDLNGDGLSDLVMDTTGLSYLYYFYINTGAGFQSDGIINLSGNTANLRAPQFLDINGDGATDLVWYDSTAKSMMVRLRGETDNKVLRANTYGDNTTGHFIMDVTGDGIFDYVEVSSSQLINFPGVMAIAGAPIPCHMESIPIPAPSANGQTYQACVGAVPNPENPVPANEQVNSIISINNGMGNITNILYGTLSNSGHYATTDVNPQTTTTQVNNDCSGIPDHNSEGYSRCMTPTIYTSTNANSFYARLNGGWDLPAGSNILQPNKTVSTTNTTKGAPVLEVNGSMRIVTSVSSSAPLASNINAMSKVDYYYGEAKIQASGRGFLGFNLLKTVDGQSGIATVTTYRQDFPFIGSPLTTTVYSASNPTAPVLSKATNTLNVRIGEASGIYQPYVATSQENSYSLGFGALLQAVTTETVIDVAGFGNPATIKVTTAGQDPISQTQLTLVKTTTNTYSTDPWELRKGRLYSATVATTRNNISDSNRTVAFTYYGLNDGNLRGMLRTEIVEPSDPVNTLSTLYTYDAWGNKKSVAITGLNALGQSETRTVTSTYDSKGRYLLSSLNDLGQSSSVNSRNEYGAPLAVSDVNGVKSQIYYDALGTEYMKVDDTGAWVRTETFYCSTNCPAGAKYFIYKRMAGGGSAKTYFDVLERVVRSSTVGLDGRNTFVDTEYDSLSRISRQSVPYIGIEGATPTAWTSYQYDLIGQPQVVTAPDTSKTTIVYANFDTSIGNALNQTRTETRNGLGQLVQVKDNLGSTINYAYTVKGELLTATTTSNGSSITVRMCYDKLGRKIGMLDPDKGGFKATVTDCTSFNSSAPPVGWWAYQYDAFGELVKQTDPKGQTTSMTYDIIGRMRSRTDKLAGGSLDNYTRWYYDTQIDGSAQLGAKGKLTAIINNSDSSQNCSNTSHCTYFAYDALTRPIQSMVMYPGDSTGYMSTTKYDDFGRAYEQHDPLEGPVLGVSGTQTHYNQYGYAYEIVDLVNGSSIQRTLTTNARGQVLTEVRGNGAVTTNTYDDQTGLLLNQNATVLGFGQPIQNNTYIWDVLGNLKTRQSQSATIGSTGSKNLSETFYYDGLNRLIKTTGSSATTPSCNGNTQDISYDGFGNIACKNSAGTYFYGTNAGPHAVTSTTTDGAYTYDSNGNQIGGAGRTLDYTSYDLVKSIAKDSSNKTEFKYGPDRGRYQRIDTRSGVGKVTTTYIGNIERIQKDNGIEWKRYVGGAIFSYKTSTNNVLQLTDKRYLYNDHLGSLDVITDSIGKVSNSESFDPWGARRRGEDWKAFLASDLNIANFDRPITQRGFTGHEMVDDMNIIHMNGRIYDQRLARFMQADPFIQSATNTQSYNRYSYVLNNPLNATDPSGFFSLRAVYKDFMKSNGQWQTHDYVNKHAPWLGVVIQHYLGYVPVWGWIIQAAYSANNSFYLSGGDFKAGASGFVGGVASHYGGVLGGAIAGGVMEDLQGGSFGHGFVTAGVGGLASGASGAVGGGWAGFFAGVIAGGAVSEMTGGKFKDGARSAAMNYAWSYADSVAYGYFTAGGGTPEPDAKPGSGSLCGKNPINIATGEKYLTMVDYAAEGASQMTFERHYSSYASEKSSLGFGWRSNFDRNLKFDTVGDTILHIVAIRHQGDAIRFDWVEGGSEQQGHWVTDNKRYELIRKTSKGWELQLTDNSLETYDVTGHLISIKKLDGYEQTLHYGKQGVAKNVLLSVTDNFSQKLSFDYDSQARMISMTANDAVTTRYTYDLADNLVKVTSPDNTPADEWDNPYKVYDYSDKRFVHAITGIRTSEGKRIHSMAYDDQGHAILSALGGDVERTDMTFSQGSNNTKQTVVKNSLGKNTIYTFDQQNKPLVIEGSPTASCIGSNQGYQYNDSGQLISKTDWNGSTTRYEYNERGLETSRVESAGKPQERRINTVWHNQWRLPIQITTADLEIEFTYSEQGQLLTRVERDLKADRSGFQKLFKQFPEREWSYRYAADGLLAEVNGPRTDVSDITHFEYDVKGNRTAVTNALGHRSEVLASNERGLPLEVRDANGVVTVLTYNVRGWPISKTFKGEMGDSITRYDYTGESDYNDQGLVSTVSLPNGQQIHYEYDAARRIIAQTNNQGERIQYELDLEGNRLSQTIYSATGQIMTSQHQVFDELSRLLQSVGADGSVTRFGYDKAGNKISAIDALDNKTAYAYDALNRLIAATDAAGGTVAKTYDYADRVNSVTDQRGLTTQYRYNAFGNKIAQISPDTGATDFGYDQAGNLISKKDARDVVTQYRYDAIGRVTDVIYPASNADNIHYAYDASELGNKGIGRLATVRDASGKQANRYNDMGQISAQVYQIGNSNYSVNYIYDLSGQLKSLQYPSGRVVNYGYSNQGQVMSVATVSKGREQTLAQHFNYLPFGPLVGFDYGNNSNLQIGRDQTYRITDIQLNKTAANDSIYDRHYGYDQTGNIVSIADRKAQKRSQVFGYDSLYRLTSANGSYGQLSYQYDAVGNRTTSEKNGRLESYSYADNSNRLLNVVSENEQSQLQNRTLNYDAAGNIIRDSVNGIAKDLQYNNSNRLAQVSVSDKQTANYQHNAKGQRVSKVIDGKVIHFHYDTADRLIAETNSSGQALREYIYAADQRIAMVDYTKNTAGEIYYMLNDHLGTPQLLLDEKQQVVWSVDQSPFGEVKTEGSIEQPLRFPGQYSDSETGYSYNYFRDYDPTIGRYIESDPIGLEGGVNTFGYVHANSVNKVDRLGLMDFAGQQMVCAGRQLGDQVLAQQAEANVAPRYPVFNKLDIFVFGSKVSELPRGFEGEAVGIFGYSSDDGLYSSFIGAAGGEIDLKWGSAGVFVGYETSSNHWQGSPILLVEGSAVKFGAGGYGTNNDWGVFFYRNLPNHESVGFGFSGQLFRLEPAWKPHN